VRARLASRNRHKVDELRAALAGWELDVVDADDYPPETGPSYVDNARAKARHGRSRAAPDVWVLGEDSGIEVDGLGGRPGPEAARFGGDDPVGRLLAAVAGLSGDARRARYVCELVAISPAGDEVRATGVLEGRIAEHPSGTEGFGYDPIFVPEGEQRTVADLGNSWKRGNSHRARAATALAAELPGAHSETVPGTVS
jgi:XTP/dITP diphosphohydrolase